MSSPHAPAYLLKPDSLSPSVYATYCSKVTFLIDIITNFKEATNIHHAFLLKYVRAFIICRIQIAAQDVYSFLLFDLLHMYKHNWQATPTGMAKNVLLGSYDECLVWIRGF